MDEHVLIENLRKGDERAFEHIYNHWWKKLFLLAFKKTGDRAIAEDTVQHIFEQLWQRREALTVQNLDSYLTTAVKYKVINYYRTVTSQDQYDSFVRETVGSSSFFTVPVTEIKEMQWVYHDAIEKLPDRTREIFKLSREEKLTNREISTSLHITEKAVEYHITRSLRVLRLRLKQFFTFF